MRSMRQIAAVLAITTPLLLLVAAPPPAAAAAQAFVQAPLSLGAGPRLANCRERMNASTTLTT